jgi:hypothetical protein
VTNAALRSAGYDPSLVWKAFGGIRAHLSQPITTREDPMRAEEEVPHTYQPPGSLKWGFGLLWQHSGQTSQVGGQQQ